MRKSIKKLKGRRYNKTRRNKKHITKRRSKTAKRKTRRRYGKGSEKKVRFYLGEKEEGEKSLKEIFDKIKKEKMVKAASASNITNGGGSHDGDDRVHRKLPAKPAPLTRRNLELLEEGRPLLGRRLRKLPETPGTVKQYKTSEGLEAKRIGSHKPIHKRIRATIDEIYDINVKLDNHKYGTAPLSRDEVRKLEASKEKKEKFHHDLQADLKTYLDRKK